MSDSPINYDDWEGYSHKGEMRSLSKYEVEEYATQLFDDKNYDWCLNNCQDFCN